METCGTKGGMTRYNMGVSENSGNELDKCVGGRFLIRDRVT